MNGVAIVDDQAGCPPEKLPSIDTAPNAEFHLGLEVMTLKCRIGAYDMLERHIAKWAPEIEREGTASQKSKLRRMRQNLAEAMAMGVDGRRVGRPNLDDPLMQRYLNEGYFEMSENTDGSPRVWWSRRRYGEGEE